MTDFCAESIYSINYIVSFLRTDRAEVAAACHLEVGWQYFLGQTSAHVFGLLQPDFRREGQLGGHAVTSVQ